MERPPCGEIGHFGRQNDVLGPGNRIEPERRQNHRYGSAYITESHTGSMKDLELPIVYYEKTDTPPTGNYTLVISTATSYLGDYLTGCDANKLWVDDFEWVY